MLILQIFRHAADVGYRSGHVGSVAGGVVVDRSVDFAPLNVLPVLQPFQSVVKSVRVEGPAARDGDLKLDVGVP